MTASLDVETEDADALPAAPVGVRPARTYSGGRRAGGTSARARPSAPLAAVGEYPEREPTPHLDPGAAPLDPRRDDDLVARRAQLLDRLQGHDRARRPAPALAPAPGLARIDRHDFAVRPGYETLDDVTLVVEPAAHEMHEVCPRVAARRDRRLHPAVLPGKVEGMAAAPRSGAPTAAPYRLLSPLSGQRSAGARGGKKARFPGSECRFTAPAVASSQTGLSGRDSPSPAEPSTQAYFAVVEDAGYRFCERRSIADGRVHEPT